MSTSSSDRSNRTVVRLAGAGERPNGHPATTFDVSLGESDRRPRAVPELPQESLDDREWNDRVAREVRHQEVIEASFDRAEAYARAGDFEDALEWLDRAATLSGGLPRAYRARRARWVSSPAMRLRATGGYQDAGSGGLQDG
jgi:tetratricopeptide (TPR) repeat protein